MAQPLDVPSVIARRYRIEDRLGRGGMGDVYRAFDEDEGRPVALKRMHSEQNEDPARARLRFRREFHTLASLRHPRIVTVYDFGVDAGVAYYTMELLDGKDFKDLGLVAPREACRLLRDVAGALAMLHARGLVHRDLAAKNARRLSNGRAKLMDFGILANFGVSGEVAGTPAYVAPETLQDMPIDGRTDLYALGVLAYVLLTGRAPYAATSFVDAALAWQRAPPAPPSVHAKDVPPALDELVMSLLAFDARARPGTAAEVISRLSAIGALEEDTALEVPRGYLASAAMVGREEELSAAREAVLRAVRGRGGAFFVRAESGTGKSRLLHEIGLEAKVSGALVASVSCETASPAPFATLDDVAAALLRTASVDVLEAAGPFASALARVIPSLRARLPEQAEMARGEDPGEGRLRVQRAVADWLVALASRTPLVLLIDDVQRCDEASAAALAALAREASRSKLLVLAAQRSGEEVRAPLAVDALAKEGKVLLLRGLTEASMGELVRALFGEAPNGARLAAQLFTATGGSPMHAMELARQYVEDGTIVFRGGLWVLPSDLRIEGAPRTLADAMDARVRGLSETTRRLGEVLALAGGSLSLDLVADLASEGDGAPRTEPSSRTVDRTFASLDELTERGVLFGGGQSYRFHHDSVREALLRGLDEARRKVLHKSVGERLLAEEDADERAAEIGFHLVYGGDERRGAELLAKGGTRLYEAQALADCLAPLETAQATLTKLGEPRGRTLPLRAMLLAAGWVSDRAVGSRHARTVVSEYREQAGIDLAERLRFLGRPLALILGSALATVRWFFRPRASRGPSPMLAGPTFAVSIGYALGLANAENRKADLAELVAMIAPFNAFRGRIPHAIYLVCNAFPDIVYGRFGLAARRLTEALPAFETDRLTPGTPTERAFAVAGVRGLRVLIDVNQLDPRVHEDCAAIDALGFRYYRLVVQATKVVRHRYRGEEAKAQALERAMEIQSIQLGSWSTDLQVLLFAHPAYALCHDVLGLERCIAAFERLIHQGFRFESRLTVTRAEWERERGNAAAAVALLEAEVASLEPEDALMRQWAGSALAEAFLAAERPAEAKTAADAVLAAAADPDASALLPQLRCKRIVALANAALGQIDVAKRSLRDAITECEALDYAPLAGAMHEARARIALAEGDKDAYAAHATEVLRWLRPTENSALIGFAERLLEAGTAAELSGSATDGGGPTMIDTAIDTPSAREEDSGSG